MPNLTRLVVLLAVCAAGCKGAAQPIPVRSGLQERIDRAVSDGTRFLLSRQSPDGAWRSDVYGQFKAGDALTPLALDALLALAPDNPLEEPCRRGSAWLADLAPGGPSAGQRDPLIYPSYTAALAVRVLGDPRNVQHARARDRWLAALLRQQLTEENGWAPTDPEYGGWGYSTAVPRKPAPDEPSDPLLPPNLSATACAAAALRDVKGSAGRASRANALRFVARCQNYGGLDPAFDDGGFFFLPIDDGRNKAGAAGVDSAGRPRYHSYGSSTADGLFALLACGAAPDDPRVHAARTWIERHAPHHTHPGTFAPECEPKRPGLYFYYCASLGRALRLPDGAEANAHAALIEELAGGLLRFQREDGSWQSTHALVREDDPVVATSLALRALAEYRWMGGRR